MLIIIIASASYYNIGNTYFFGKGVERDAHYWRLAAIGGDIKARYNLGVFVVNNAGNYERALKHFLIAVGSGDNESLKQVKQLCMRGRVTKDDYAKALQAYQTYLDEIKSDQRDAAAAHDEGFKYY